MLVNVLQENLKIVLGLVGKVTNESDMIFTSGVSTTLLTTENNKLKISGTSVVQSLVCWIDADVKQHGSILVPTKTFSDYITAMPIDRLTIEDKTSKTGHFSCGNTVLKLRLVPVAEFPNPPAADPIGEVSFEVQRVKLLEAINHVAYAASSDQTRPSLTGVLFNVNKAGKLSLVGGDGSRLSVVKMDIECDKDIKVTLPKKSCSVLSAVLGEATAEIVKVMLTQNASVFDMENVEYRTQNLIHKFPDYENAIPKSSTTTAKVSKDEFLRAVRMSNVISKQGNNIIKVSISQGSIVLESSAKELGENINTVKAEVEGDDVVINLSCKFLLELLANIIGSNLVVKATTPVSPVLVCGSDECLSILMPMYVAGG